MATNLIQTLNDLLADERAAENQYRLQSGLAERWGYKTIAAKFAEEQHEESEHAGKLVARIYFLSGTPDPKTIGEVNVGDSLQQMLDNNLQSELRAIRNYDAAITATRESWDHGTAHMLESILVDEEGHLLWIEAQKTLISQMGLDNWLTEQT